MSGEGVHNPADVELLALEATVDDIQTDVTTILAQTAGLGVLTETGGTLTADGTEQNIYYEAAPAAVFEPRFVKVDFTDHTATETVVLRVYYRIVDGGGLIEQDTQTFIGLVSPELIKIGLEPNRWGIQVTLEKTAGTNRDYDWEVVYET